MYTDFPKKHGFSMPAEWSEHTCTLMEWPVRTCIWPTPLEETYTGYQNVAHAIAQFEPVIMIARADAYQTAKKYCGESIEILQIEHDDSWMRDNGPTFVTSEKGDLAGIQWDFNAWGEKYAPWDQDRVVATKVLEHLHIPMFKAPFVLEGGSIHVDGEGTLLTTEECLLNCNRNPNLSKEEIEYNLKEYLNIDQVIWLKKGVFNDETDGHVDNIACFAKPGVVLLQTCHDPEDPNYEITRQNLEVLHNSPDAKGRSLTIIEIPQPPATYYQGERLPLSYINFYFVNGGIILPVFGGHCSIADQKAIEILSATFPDRKIVPIDGMPIIKGGGNIHCITQQMPIGRNYHLSQEVRI